MAGGGTGGHVYPALAVARQLRSRGHEVLFVGTQNGLESRLVPQDGFPLEFIRIGGLKGVGVARQLRTLLQLPVSTWQVYRLTRRYRPAAVFSSGGFAAGPVMLAAVAARVPLLIMEPNALPGFTNRHMGRFAQCALLNFPEAGRFFPPGKSLVTGVPVRENFFALPVKPRARTLSLLITGGSRGSRTLNHAARESWPLFAGSGLAIRIVHQTGPAEFDSLEREFRTAGVEGRVVDYIEDMPAAFAEADLIICRSGAGAVSELAAACKPAVLVPFPHAADDHQSRNAEAMVRAGAARLVPDKQFTGKRLFEEVAALSSEPGLLEKMADAAGAMARPGAASQAADLLESLAGIDRNA